MCAENSIGWTTSGTGDGSASGYTMAQFTEWQRMMATGFTGADLSGVAPDYLNKLAVSGTSTPVAVNTGGALVYGFPYFNSASVNVTIPTPSISTRIDRIVLRVNWAAQTVRVARVAGTEGAGAPTLTQTASTTWEMALAQASITTGGVITLTDQREWLSMVGDGTVTLAKMAANSVDTSQLVANAVTTAKITDANVTTAKIADANVTLAKIQNIATDSLVGRDTASTGAPENITLGASLSMTGAQVLQRAALTGDVTAAANSNATTIAANAVTTAKILDANVTLAKLASDVVFAPKVMYIPIVAFMGNPGSGGSISVASTSYVELYPQIEITKESFPSTCTVKLVALISAGTTNLKSVELYNKTTSASVTGSEVTTTFSAGIIQIKSGDFRANLTAGANRYTARMKKAAGSISVYAIYLMVEW